MRSRLAALAASAFAGVVASPLPAQDPPASPGGTDVRIPGLQALTVTGEYRVRFEAVYNYDLDDEITDDQDFFTQRVRLGFDAKVTEDLGAFVQIQDVRLWGEETSTVDDSADGLDVHQAYMRWDRTPLGGDARLGRQTLIFGDERLVGGLEWLSQGRAFDGIRHTWRRQDSYTIDAFVTQIREAAPSPVYADAHFAGVYATISRWDDTELDVYWLFLNDEETSAGGNEARSTVGARFEQRYGGLEVGVEAAAQFGEQDGADVDPGDAYALHLHGTWTFAAASRPYCRIEADLASGDDPATPENERFATLFPTAHAHLGMMDFALWENVRHGAIEVGVRPTENSKLALSYHTFESVEETDRFVGPVGRPAPAGAPAGSSRSIGDEIDLFYNVELGTGPARTWIQAGYGIFLPGSGARAAVSDDDTAHYFYLMTGVTF